MENNLTTVYSPNPVDPSQGRQVVCHLPTPGQTLRETLLANGVDPYQPIVIVRNDEMVRVEDWDRICPVEGDIIHVLAAVSGGGGGGSNPLKIVLTIALAVFAPTIAGFMLSGGASWAAVPGFVGSLATVGVMLAGTAIINAIFPVPSMDLKGVSSDTDTSPTYSLSGGQNRARAYDPLPIVFGTHRIFPDMGAKAYTTYEGNNQYLNLTLNYGLSNLQISDIKLGTDPLSNFTDLTYTASDQSGNLPTTWGDVDSLQGAALIKGASPIVRTSSANTVKLEVDVAGMAYIAGDNGLLNTWVKVEVLYRKQGDSAWLPVIPGTELRLHTHYLSLIHI